jgi:hypothetical protein
MLAFPENEIHDIFAFSYFFPVQDATGELLESGWDIYKKPEAEFQRQGLTFPNVSLLISVITI